MVPQIPILPKMVPQILFLLSLISLPTILSLSTPSIYDILKSNGLPMGLLPTGITNFLIDDNSGNFEVHLEKECNAKFENELHYDRNVTGTLSYGKIKDLSGISAQDLFLWFSVKVIYVDVPSSGLIYFDVGVVSKQFSLSLFDTPRECTAVMSFVGDKDVSKNLASQLRYRLDQGNIKTAIF